MEGHGYLLQVVETALPLCGVFSLVCLLLYSIRNGYSFPKQSAEKRGKKDRIYSRVDAFCKTVVSECKF